MSGRFALGAIAALLVAGSAAATTNTNSNTGAVSNGGRAPTVPVAGTERIDTLDTYHWNGGRGARPGMISIRNSSGQTLGTWPATGSSGQGGAPNVNWTVHPNITLTTGMYTIVDSDPATWSQNSGSGGFGFFTMSGTQVVSGTPPVIPIRPVTPVIPVRPITPIIPVNTACPQNVRTQHDQVALLNCACNYPKTNPPAATPQGWYPACKAPLQCKGQYGASTCQY